MKAQDMVVLLKLLSDGGRQGTFASLAHSIGMSPSETHGAFGRARDAGLIHPIEDRVRKAALAEFLIHGLKYVFPVRPGERTRGIPTGSSAAPLAEFFNDVANEDQLVWPDSEGQVAGLSITPLYRSVPKAVFGCSVFYEWMVLADALRGAGRARERELAEQMVRERLGYHASR